MSDWYGVSQKDIGDRGGRGLFKQYASLYEVLKVIYPEYPWEAQQFVRMPSDYWASLDHRRECLQRICAELGITEVT